MYSCGNFKFGSADMSRIWQGSRPRRRRFLGDRRGVTAIEFAIVLPLFIMAILGTIEFGRAMAAWNDSSRALSRAVRAINLDPNQTSDQVSALLKKYLTDTGAKDVSVSVTPKTISGTEYMKITASFPFSVTIPFATVSDFNIVVDTLAPVMGPTK